MNDRPKAQPEPLIPGKGFEKVMEAETVQNIKQKLANFNEENVDILTREFAESQTLQPINQCVKLRNFDLVEKTVGVVTRTPFKRTYQISENLISHALLIPSQESKFDQETTRWYSIIKAPLDKILTENPVPSTEKLINEFGADNIVGAKGVFQFILAFSRISDVVCNLSPTSTNSVFLGISKNRTPASYVVLKEKLDTRELLNFVDTTVRKITDDSSLLDVEHSPDKMEHYLLGLLPTLANAAGPVMLKRKVDVLLNLAAIKTEKGQIDKAEGYLIQADEIIENKIAIAKTEDLLKERSNKLKAIITQAKINHSK